jgi:hypothetical protein
MTGQVKEEILIRLGELGVRVRDGRVTFAPWLLRDAEFLAEPERFVVIGVDGVARELALAAGTLAFTYCQVPIIYRRSERRGLRITAADGTCHELAGDTLDAERSAALFARTGAIVQIEVDTAAGQP